MNIFFRCEGMGVQSHDCVERYEWFFRQWFYRLLSLVSFILVHVFNFFLVTNSFRSCKGGERLKGVSDASFYIDGKRRIWHDERNGFLRESIEFDDVKPGFCSLSLNLSLSRTHGQNTHGSTSLR